MTENPSKQDELSVYLANELVSLANAKLDAGLDRHSIAVALQNAAANFTAFTSVQDSTGQKLDKKTAKKTGKKFEMLFAYYLGLHSNKPE